MNPVNLLAFIQIAVAFDFGLLLLGSTHGFRTLHSDIQTEFNEKFRKTIEECETLCKSTQDTRNIPIRSCRAELKESLSVLIAYLSPNYAQWSKYSYLGIFAGMYGLLFLLIIGLFDGTSVTAGTEYLIVIGLTTLIFEIFSQRQTKRSETRLSYIELIFRFTVLLLLYFGIGYLYSIIDEPFLFQYLEIKPEDYQTALILLSTLAVYFPILVYVWRIASYVIDVGKAFINCSTDLRELKEKL